MSEEVKTKKAVKPAADITPESVADAKRTYSQQEFLDEYAALCQRTGWELTATGTPALKMMGDLGGALITVQLQFAVTPVKK